jgi:hypothetical protein
VYSYVNESLASFGTSFLLSHFAETQGHFSATFSMVPPPASPRSQQ